MSISINDFLAILNTRRYTEEEVTELSTRLKEMSTDALEMLFLVAANKDDQVNGTARRESRHTDIQRRWEALLFHIRRAYDHAKIRENKGPWILSTEHHLDIVYYSYKKMAQIFNM